MKKKNINPIYFRSDSTMNVEDLRGKYVSSSNEILIIDYRLKKGDIYDISGKLGCYNFIYLHEAQPHPLNSKYQIFDGGEPF